MSLVTKEDTPMLLNQLFRIEWISGVLLLVAPCIITDNRYIITGCLKDTH
jgi:hypothetical protein